MFSPILARSGPSLLDSGPTVVDVGRTWACTGRVRPQFGRLRVFVGRFQSVCVAKLGKCGPISTRNCVLHSHMLPPPARRCPCVPASLAGSRHAPPPTTRHTPLNKLPPAGRPRPRHSPKAEYAGRAHPRNGCRQLVRTSLTSRTVRHHRMLHNSATAAAGEPLARLVAMPTVRRPACLYKQVGHSPNNLFARYSLGQLESHNFDLMSG